MIFYSKSVEKTPGVMGCYMSRPGQAVDLLLCAFVQITSKALENDLQYAIGNVMLPVTSSSMTGLAVGQWRSGEAELHRSCKKTYRDCLVTVCSKTWTWVNCRRSFWGVLAPPVLPCTEEQILVLQLGWCLCFSPCSLFSSSGAILEELGYLCRYSLMLPVVTVTQAKRKTAEK